MTMRIAQLAIVPALLLAACAGGTGYAPAVAMAAPETAALAELPTQLLQPGQCALVLWSRNSTPVRLAVTLDRPAIARVSIKGRTIELSRVAQSGQSIHGQFPEQHYRGDGLSLQVSFAGEDARQLSGGAVVSSAVVEFVDAAGWTSIIPAVGLIACQS